MRNSIRRRRRDARRRTQAKRRVYDALLSLEKSGQLVLPPAAPGAAPRTAAPAAAPAAAAAAAPPSSSSGAGRRAEERSSDAGRPADGEHESVLLLGEGDFSYALALQRARPRWKIWATTPDSEEAIFTEHGLDALEAFAETGDVSFDVESGLRTGKLVRSYIDAMPPLRPLVLVLKFFLSQRGLNETFTGGVGSFMMQMMVVSFLQMRHRTDCATNLASAPNLGALLLEFFELYGKDFNYGATGISVRHHGSYFPKRSRGWDYPQRPQLLALENPDDASLDVGKNSFAMTRVKRAFEHAHAKLSLACCGDDWRAACLLGSAVDATVLNPRVASSLEDTT